MRSWHGKESQMDGQRSQLLQVQTRCRAWHCDQYGRICDLTLWLGFIRKNNINACVWKTQFIQIDIIKLTQDSLIADWITMFEYSKAHYSKSGLSLKNFKMATPVWNCLHGIREHWVCHVCLRIVSLLFDFATKNKFAFGDYFLPFSRQMAT